MIMIVTLILGMSTMAYRALALALGWVEVSPFQTRDSLNTVFYMINYLGMFFLSFGFVLSTVEQSAEKNRRFAQEDPLTGLSNRRALFDAMDNLFASAKSAGTPTTIMIIDIDHFKQVNDRYGHQAGDAVLLRVAETIEQRLRDRDIVGRIGGEEFLAVLPDTPINGAKRVAEELRETLASSPIIHEQQEIPVTISIGLHHSAQMHQPLDTDSMIASADEALYLAKARGRNRVEVAEAVSG
jgi:diguanylate cyclase (GGDEF)-like protein